MPDLYRRATEHPGANFYRDALEPLFFEVLNTERGGQDSPFGSVPYLNGSLFEREYPLTTVLNLPNSLFDPKATGSILNVLGGYNFTVSESSSLEQEISLDPEMLGKVFENMMEEEEAAQSGTFYTPRSIVQFMAEETLTRYLSDHTGISQDRLLPLTADDSDPHDLTLAEAGQIIQALEGVRVLDPAVGTASMLVGFLNAMIRVRRSAEAKRGIHAAEGSPALAQWKRQYIQHSLYGVDIKHEAIEIARLRLWLSLVVDAQESEPLPNLDYKLMAGDGLLETVDGAPFIRVEQAVVGDEAAIADKARAIEAKHEEFFGEQRPEQRRVLRAEIQALERELFKADVDYRIKGLDSQIRLLDRQIADPHQAERTRGTLTKRRTALADNMGRLIDQKVKVWDEQEPLPFFLHNVHFAEVMRHENRSGNGGFDIVIGNPPYVSIGNMKATYKAALKQAFPDVESGRADLYVYFYQKSLNLLREGGRLAYITPNRFMKIDYGEGIRKVIADKATVEIVVDFGHIKVFDAHTFPAIVVLRKGEVKTGHVSIISEQSLRRQINRGAGGEIPLYVIREALQNFHISSRGLIEEIDVKFVGKEKWMIEDARLLNVLSKMMARGKPLSEIVSNKILSGIKTGLNEAFIIDKETRDMIIKNNPQSEMYVKPFLRGRDISRWSSKEANFYLIVFPTSHDETYKNSWSSLESKAAEKVFSEEHPQIYEILSLHREKLIKRGDKGKFWWELRPCSYYDSFTKPRISWGKYGSSPRFFYDIDSRLYVNTVYFLNTDKKWILSMLNSNLFLVYYRVFFNIVNTGFIEFIGQSVERLPFITPTPEQARRLEGFTDDSRLDELNALVYELYGLNAGEIALVEELTAGAYGGAGAEAASERED
ncbi:Eco57I restriction-modification methylase domain-containing protein [Deinococcus radiophilus]|uniref:Eco57I restriction-modification methylase domain-containing protein n=1 Tax=Deinococcus radiophilus TaxID=32062 RepID=UPI00361360CD